jgi:hypothetical protein
MWNRINDKRAQLEELVKKGELHLTEKKAISGWTEESLHDWADSWLHGPVITEEHLRGLWIEQAGACALTGLKLTTKPNNPDTGSVDRRDSRRGYEPDNVQWVCGWVNFMKGPLDEELFFDRCELLATRRPHWNKQEIARLKWCLQENEVSHSTEATKKRKYDSVCGPQQKEEEMVEE